MKLTHTLKYCLPALLAGLILAGATNVGLAQALPPVRTFDSDNGNWATIWWTWGDQSCTWDSSRDANYATNSGSQRYEANFSGSDGGIWGTLNGGAWDSTIVYDNSAGGAATLSLDICIDPSSTLDSDNNYSWFNFELVDPDWNQTVVGGFTMTDINTNWTHVVFPITPGAPTNIVGFMIWVWGGNYSGGHLAFNVDNVALNAPAPKITLLNPARLPTGEFQFTITNLTAGDIYSVMSSTNLMDWVDENDFIPTDTSYDYTDTTAATMPQKFYGVRPYQEP